MIGFILAAVAAVIAIAVIALYNGFVTKKNRVQTAWAQIDVQLKRRYDLIPNLVNTVKGYKNYEKDVLTKVTQLRTSIISGSVQDKATANNQLSQALKSIFAVAENYPDLKASENFKMLQQQLADTEDKIAFVRTSYNDYVLDYNNAIMEFPGNVFAPILHFSKQDFFQAPDDQRAQINVDFDDPGGQGGQGAAQKPAGKSNKK